MKNTVRAAALGLALSAVVSSAGALGIGRLPNSATLGHPLDIAIPLRLESGESLTPDCLAATVSFADNLQQPGTTSLRLEPARPDATERTLRLVTTTRVDEPIVTVELTLGCGSRVSRQFTLFADPPLVTAALPAEPPLTAAEPAASAPARLDDVPVPQAQAEASPPRPAPRRAASAPPRRAADTSGRSASPAPRAAASATARPPSGARLKLAPLEAGTAIAAASARPGAQPPADASSSAPDSAAATASGVVSPGALEAAALGAVAAAQEAASAASAARAAEAAAAARAAQLDEALQRARADSASAQNAIAALRADLDRMRSQGSASSPWLIDLLLLALVLALAALVWLWRQRQQDREAAQWMQAGAAGAAAERGPEFEEPPESVSSVSSQTPALSTRVLADEEYEDSGPSGRTGPITMPMPPGLLPAATEPKREVSVEELIDLEQQAEFFVVLGQDEAAIDLLMGHLRSTSGTSPLPYLKLLEIYKRRGEHKPYELLRERFNGRFSAIAPAWDTDWQTGRSLEDYPSVLARLQSLWYSPPRAMEVLQATLMRPVGAQRDAAGDQDGFDLPAYRELMFLYAVARDRAETETGGSGVDVLLPLGGADGAEPTMVFERLVATTSLEAQPSVRAPLTIDLPIDDVPTTTAAAVILHPPEVDFDPSELPPLEPLPPSSRER
jgi:hypothetical protein